MIVVNVTSVPYDCIYMGIAFMIARSQDFSTPRRTYEDEASGTPQCPLACYMIIGLVSFVCQNLKSYKTRDIALFELSFQKSINFQTRREQVDHLCGSITSLARIIMKYHLFFLTLIAMVGGEVHDLWQLPECAVRLFNLILPPFADIFSTQRGPYQANTVDTGCSYDTECICLYSNFFASLTPALYKACSAADVQSLFCPLPVQGKNRAN